MRIAIVAVVIIIGLLGAGFLSGQKDTQNTGTNTATQTQYKHIIDVRTPEEYAASHAQSATLHPLQKIEAGTMPDVDKNSKIAIYCRSGNRSAQAKKLLEKNGFTNVTDLGGLTDLSKHGISLEK